MYFLCPVLERDDVQVLTRHKALRLEMNGDSKILSLNNAAHQAWYAAGTDQGFVNVLTQLGKDTIWGEAGDLLTEFILAMQHGLALNKILGTMHTYSTMFEV